MTEAEYKFVYGEVGWKRRPANWQELPVPPYQHDTAWDRDHWINNHGKGSYTPDINEVCFSKADAIAKGRKKNCLYIS